ncbi:MAG TPA: glycosyltransferase [Tepidisphaeraceae bacterium]|nr:glycosyltransferase [Tepidisphaeraceae bacterium]
MRIHVYLREFPPTGDRLISGMIKAVHGLAAGFAHNGAHVTVLCDGPQSSVFESPDGYDIRCFAHTRAEGGNYSSLPRSLQRYIDQSDDGGIYLLNGIFSPCVYQMSRACIRNGIPYIVAPHDPYHPSIFGTNRHLKWPYWYLRERPMLRQARAVQVLDFRHAEWLRALGVHTPVVEVVNGYAPEDVQPMDILNWRTEGPPKLIYLGRIDSHNKGLDILLDAFAQITDRTDAQLTLQGPDWGDKQAMIRRAERLNLTRRVTFRDPDFAREATLISADHDVFLLPSRFEGFGLSALEAMLAGRVVMVSDVAGIAPHVRASGCGLVVSADTMHVKSGLLELLSMRSRWKEMGLAGREYALNHLKWERIAARTIDNYRSMLHQHPAPTAAAAV